MIIDLLPAQLVSSHTRLTDHLVLARTGHQQPGPRSNPTRAADAFLAATSQHLAAVIEVIVPASRKHSREGARDAQRFVRECRMLEKALVVVKGKLYGSAYPAHLPWPRVWRHVAGTLGRVLEAEQHMIDRLAADVGPAQQALLVSRWAEVEPKAPTRPHPYLPHSGARGRLARRIWARADRAWDYAEGRVLPVAENPGPAAAADRPIQLPRAKRQASIASQVRA